MRPLLEGRFPPNDAFERMRSNGWLGQKSGRGFYAHSEEVHDAQRPGREPAAGRRRDRRRGAALTPEARLAEARERMVLLMVNEAALALSEGLAESGDMIDLAMVLGTGWAPHRGGPLRYADERGLSNVVEALTGLAGRRGKRFEACAELKTRAAEGRAFYV